MEPLVVYKVFADGRPDELVRGVDIVGTPLISLQKIVATGDTTEVFNGYCGAESGSVPVAAASPALLISEMEVEKKETPRTARRFCRRRRTIPKRQEAGHEPIFRIRHEVCALDFGFCGAGRGCGGAYQARRRAQMPPSNRAHRRASSWRQFPLAIRTKR